MASAGGQVCGVCDRPMQLRVEIADCDHSFCYGCIRASLRVRANCPVCSHGVTWVKIGGFDTLELQVLQYQIHYQTQCQERHMI